MEMREFTKNDWMGFAGAERAEEEVVKKIIHEPQICIFGGACEGKDGECTIIVDKNGIGIQWIIEEPDTADAVYLNGGPWFSRECSFREGLWIVSKLTIEDCDAVNLRNNPMFNECDERRDK